jgi:uncharacterized membrane protein
MRRLVISAAIGLVVALIIGDLLRWAYAPVAGWDSAALAYCAMVWTVIWPLDAAATAKLARAEDPGRPTGDVLTLCACVASQAAVWVVFIGAHSTHGAAAEELAGLGLASVAISWFTVHTIFALRYALIYYADHHGGVNFNQQQLPCYRDFCYLSLTVGMTFQVSDTDLTNTAFRSTVLRQALLSYLFSAVVLAATINLIAGLGSSGSIG